MFKKYLMIAVMGAGMLVSSLASAATTTFNFTTDSFAPSSVGINFLSDGIGLTVLSGFYNGSDGIQAGFAGQTIGSGIYVRQSISDEPYIDGSGLNDVAILQFDQNVRIESIGLREFNHTFAEQINGRPETFAYFADVDGDGKVELQDQTLKDTSLTFVTGLMREGNLFGIGAMLEGTDFYLASVTVSTISAVPLPPAFLVFASALGGLGWFSRRRRMS